MATMKNSLGFHGFPTGKYPIGAKGETGDKGPTGDKGNSLSTNALADVLRISILGGKIFNRYQHQFVRPDGMMWYINVAF